MGHLPDVSQVNFPAQKHKKYLQFEQDKSRNLRYNLLDIVFT